MKFMAAMNDASVSDLKGGLIEIHAIDFALPGGKLCWNERLEWDTNI